ncbi:biotin-independent malonate decarboxylase subunit gamma [Nocardia sp. NPDC005825]|uniref:biotin-independent malonate decarboxylase subunit gamma n=1 Tax=unclassified Nocardia TaxID=2637762 RepID=UPI0033D45A77
MTTLGSIWLRALSAPPVGEATASPAVRWGSTGDLPGAVLLTITADVGSRFPRARAGQVGLDQCWAFADLINGIVEADRISGRRRAIVVLVDTPGQAYGYREELAGIHQGLAAATAAMATARAAGHPTVALIVGSAVSGAFLATGLQAGALLALDHPDARLAVMSARSTAVITRRSEAEVERDECRGPGVSHHIGTLMELGVLSELIPVTDAWCPTPEDLAAVRAALGAAIAGLGSSPQPEPPGRLDHPAARTTRAASIAVRERIWEQWDV